EEQRLAGADGGAHGLLADAGPVVTHVALHHELPIFVDLGHSERTREHAIPAGDAAWLARALDHAVAGALDRISGTDLSARRMVVTTIALSVIEARRVSAVVQSPSLMPSFSASRG